MNITLLTNRDLASHLALSYLSKRLKGHNFSLFISEFSEDMPFFYGLFSIMFAILLGVGAALIRRIFSNFKKKMLLKKS